MKYPNLWKQWKPDVLGGITTFFTMAYIVIVNPSILSTAGTGMPLSGVLTATVLVCFSMTLFMGLYARLPYAVAPGMGINAFFTYSLILGKGIAWPVALGMVFWAGVLFVVVSITPIRIKIAQAIPQHLRKSAAVGIGLFLAFIGFKTLGIVRPDPVTYLKFGKITWPVIVSLVGMLGMVIGVRKKSPFSFLGGMLFISFVLWISRNSIFPEQWVSSPDFKSVFLKLDVWGALQLALLPAVISIFVTDLFDSISTFVGVSHAAGLVDQKGDPIRLKEGLIVDAFATLGAGLAGTSSGTAYIESAAGIEMGGRTGRSAIVTALCFLPCLYLGPLVEAIPPHATAPVLVVVGILMFRTVAEISWRRIEEAVPAFFTILLIPFTFSITQGILWGFLTHVILFALVGRRRELSPTMWILGVSSAGLLVLEQFTSV